MQHRAFHSSQEAVLNFLFLLPNILSLIFLLDLWESIGNSVAQFSRIVNNTVVLVFFKSGKTIVLGKLIYQC